MGDLLMHPSASQRRIVALTEQLAAANAAVVTMRYHIAAMVIANGGSAVVPVNSPFAWELKASETEDGLGIVWSAKIKEEPACEISTE